MSTPSDPVDPVEPTDPYAEVTVRYDHEIAERALAQVKRTVVGMVITSVVAIIAMLLLAFLVFSGTARMVLVLVAIMAVGTQLVLLPRIMLMANKKATEPYTADGVAFTMGSEGIRLPDALRTMSLRWSEVSLGPAGNPENPSQVMIRLAAGDDERLYLRDALTPAAEDILASAQRLRG